MHVFFATLKATTFHGELRVANLKRPLQTPGRALFELLADPSLFSEGISPPRSGFEHRCRFQITQKFLSKKNGRTRLLTRAVHNSRTVHNPLAYPTSSLGLPDRAAEPEGPPRVWAGTAFVVLSLGTRLVFGFINTFDCIPSQLGTAETCQLITNGWDFILHRN